MDYGLNGPTTSEGKQYFDHATLNVHQQNLDDLDIDRYCESLSKIVTDIQRVKFKRIIECSR